MNSPVPPPPDCQRCGRPTAEHRAGRCPGGWGADLAAATLMALGVVLFILGGAVWLMLNNDAHVCGSGLVYALDQTQCSTYTTLPPSAAGERCLAPCCW